MNDRSPEGDPLYPIYNISAKWVQDGTQSEHNSKPPLPEGRIHNSTSFSRMYKEDPGLDGVVKEAEEWWEKFSRNEKHKDKNLSAQQIDVKFLRNETWCIGWFNHYTFDIGQSNADAIASFHLFIYRMEYLIRTEGESAYCLMGAEDWWRWGSVTDDGERSDSFPCRCRHCKERGVLSINH